MCGKCACIPKPYKPLNQSPAASRTLVVVEALVRPAGLKLQRSLPAACCPAAAAAAKIYGVPAARKALQPLGTRSTERLDGSSHVSGPSARVAAGGGSAGRQGRGRLPKLSQHLSTAAAAAEAIVNHLRVRDG